MRQDHIARYVTLMHEIKRRHFSIEAAINGPFKLPFKPIVVDHSYLQFRKILELISFSVLSANDELIEKLNKGVAREYHAEKLLSAIEKKFGDVYPRPIIQVLNPQPGIAAEFVNRERGYLTRSEFRGLYGQCGDVLHSRNPFRKPIDLDKPYEQIAENLEKIRGLLDSHIAHIVGDPNLYLVQMNGGVDHSPTYTIFSPQHGVKTAIG